LKRIRLTVLILIFAFLTPFVPLLGKAEVFADQNQTKDTVSTGIFLPTSYLQYYKLDNPFAICRYKGDGEEFVAISHKDAIVVYSNEKFAQIPLELNGKSVSVLQRYQNYLLFLYKSTIHTIDISGFDSENWTATPKDTGIICNNSFYVCGDYIVRHDSNYVYKHKIKSDLSGGFAIDEGEYVDEDLTAMVLLSKTGNIYYSKVDADGIYLYDGTVKTSFYPQAKNVSAFTESDDGKTIYYSCPEGVFAIDVATAQRTTVCEATEVTQDADLGKIYSPKGICYLDGKLWIVDSEIKAVQEIDLNTNGFTQFAITTNSQAINRLSNSVQDVTVDKDKIYALDKNRIVVINDINSADRTYNRINLPNTVDKFSAGDGYICYTNEKTVNVCKLVPSQTDENIFDLEPACPPTILQDVGNVVDVSFAEGCFYLLSTTILGDGLSHPAVYKIDLDNQTLVLEPILAEGTMEGYAIQVVADVFGTVYYCTEKGGFYEFYSYDGNQVTLVNTIEKQSAIRNMQTDFDGKLYCLFDDNKIICIDGQEITEKTLETSKNLGDINPAKSMCLSCNSSVAYFIFEGLILSSSSPTDLNISTPHTIDIPDGFNTSFDENQQFARVKEGAKLFKVDVSNLSGEHFKFIDYSEANSSTQDYAVKPLDDKYSILICDGISAVARNSDITQTFTVTAESFERFAVVDFSPYNLPVLQSIYKTQTEVDKFGVVKINASVEFNGIKYYVVDYDGNLGYIPDTFLVESIVDLDSIANLSSAYVFNKDGVDVFDKDGKIIGRFDKKSKVTIISYGEKLTIVYGDGIGFVDSNSLVHDSNAEILKSIAIFLGALSICVTALFFEKRYLLKK